MYKREPKNYGVIVHSNNLKDDSYDVTVTLNNLFEIKSCVFLK